jgi:regulator of RNase E activity RraB
MTEANEHKIREAISGHNARNASLKQSLLAKNVDINRLRFIDLHFWVASRVDAEDLANSLRSRGLTILVQRRAATADETLPWNIEAQVTQSVDLTIAPEFTEELVRLANSHNGRYDGWGTQI